ncbi:hypothetical protein [Kribbella sp. NPDC049584]|uniref:hypothetical protein n=1 Tax=Kribbella sp. NPDC049584 TaxID=3154833 RepID=UPI003438781C
MQGVEIWNQINESARVVVWPAVVVLGLILFRTKLGDVVQRLREADTPVGTMKFDPSEQIAANQDISKSAGILVETVRAQIEEAARPSDETEDAVSAVPTTARLEDLKKDVEAVISASFTAGYEAAQYNESHNWHLKEGRIPSPLIEWEGSVPQVAGYEVSTQDYVLSSRALEASAEGVRLADQARRVIDQGLAEIEEKIKVARMEGNEVEAQRLERVLAASEQDRERLDSAAEAMRDHLKRFEQFKLTFRRRSG